MLSFEEALATVKERLAETGSYPVTETLPLGEAFGRILAEDVLADRDYPPFHRSTRDGFAVRAADVSSAPAMLERIGEVQAGGHFPGGISAGQCVEIMTGAPLPEGADAVAMVEHTRLEAAGCVFSRALSPWENVVRRGSEAPAGSTVLPRGRRVGPGEAGLLASVGKGQVNVFVQPSVAILPTGDEVVPIEQTPEWFQIRNSNAAMLAAQAKAAGAQPRIVGVAPDEKKELRRMIQEGLQSDLLILSGGVSMGKFDLVTQVFGELGADFFFHGVAIRPGKPLLFGGVSGKFFFGLPGNPVSSYVTFELFARSAIRVLAGASFEEPVFLRARAGKPLRQKHGLTAFLPARFEMQGSDPVAIPVGWQGSGDMVGLAAANCFMVIHPEQSEIESGAWVDVLPKEQ